MWQVLRNTRLDHDRMSSCVCGGGGGVLGRGVCVAGGWGGGGTRLGKHDNKRPISSWREFHNTV